MGSKSIPCTRYTLMACLKTNSARRFILLAIAKGPNSLLSQKESIGVMEASEHLNISHPAVIQFVKELEKKGWVMSEKSPEDARKRILKLTEKGWAFLPQLQEIWDNIKTVNQQLISKEAHDLMRSVEAFEQYFLKDGFYIDYYQKYIDEKSK